ncbi:hypothetical protein STEG23_031457, partial [Scotinomys teguina]
SHVGRSFFQPLYFIAGETEAQRTDEICRWVCVAKPWETGTLDPSSLSQAFFAT